MATIAIYSPKGGVGKTTLAVNLAWTASSIFKRRILLWDLDAQAAASFILTPNRKAGDEARAIIEKELDAEQLVLKTSYPLLDLIPADTSLRALDTLFADIDRKKRLLRITQHLQGAYDHVILDCPPGLGSTGEQIIRGSTVILVPMIPSSLSRRSFSELQAHLIQTHKGGPPMFPVFNMVDRRRRIHRHAMRDDPGCPAIPMSSAVEMMADVHEPLGAYAPKNLAATATRDLWRSLERKILGNP